MRSCAALPRQQQRGGPYSTPQVEAAALHSCLVRGSLGVLLGLCHHQRYHPQGSQSSPSHAGTLLHRSRHRASLGATLWCSRTTPQPRWLNETPGSGSGIPRTFQPNPHSQHRRIDIPPSRLTEILLVGLLVPHSLRVQSRYGCLGRTTITAQSTSFMSLPSAGAPEEDSEP
jgi:hypothetical protein